MSDNSAKMARLLGRLKVEMNGAVSQSMREHGIVYPLNYGVSVPTIRAVAAEYAPDHTLARLLYHQQVRELKLAALIIAEPQLIASTELAFWAEGVENTEVAEHLASGILGSPDLPEQTLDAILGTWLIAENDLLRYAAFLSAARQVSVRGLDPFVSTNLQGNIVASLQSERRFVWQGAAAFLAKLATLSPEGKHAAEQILAQAANQRLAASRYLEEELGWLFK